MDKTVPGECKHGIEAAYCAYCLGKITTGKREEEQPSKRDVYERIGRREERRTVTDWILSTEDAEEPRQKIQKPEVRAVILPSASAPPLPIPPALLSGPEKLQLPPPLEPPRDEDRMRKKKIREPVPRPAEKKPTKKTRFKVTRHGGRVFIVKVDERRKS